jgi:DNA invertase Pin-like site-specific DNA recombinase
LLADTNGLYDPTDYHDRLRLRLQGTLNEAEHNILKDHLPEGRLNKAKRVD